MCVWRPLNGPNIWMWLDEFSGVFVWVSGVSFFQPSQTCSAGQPGLSAQGRCLVLHKCIFNEITVQDDPQIPGSSQVSLEEQTVISVGWISTSCCQDLGIEK